MKVETAARPHHRPAHRGRRAEDRRHHHPGLGEGKAAAGQGHRRAARARSKEDGKRQPLDVKAGDTILFGKCSGQEIKIDGEDYLIMREDEVLARARATAK